MSYAVPLHLQIAVDSFLSLQLLMSYCRHVKEQYRVHSGMKGAK